MSVGRKIGDARRLQRMTQGELATAAGLARNTVSRIERDERSPGVHTARALTAALDMSLSDLYDDPKAPAPDRTGRGTDMQEFFGMYAVALEAAMRVYEARPERADDVRALVEDVLAEHVARGVGEA